MSEPSSSRVVGAGATALSLLVVGLDMTVLNVALPDIATDLGATTSSRSGSRTPTSWLWPGDAAGRYAGRPVRAQGLRRVPCRLRRGLLVRLRRQPGVS